MKQGRIDKDNNARVMVVMSEIERRRIIRLFDLGHHEVETWAYLQAHFFDGKCWGKRIWLDDADMFLQEKFRSMLEGISLTTTNEMKDNIKRKMDSTYAIATLEIRLLSLQSTTRRLIQVIEEDPEIEIYLKESIDKNRRTIISLQDAIALLRR